jgi:magnesium transporter
MDNLPHLQAPALSLARQNFTILSQDWSLQQALNFIRQRGTAEQIDYFYVVGANNCLAGVLSTRRLLTAPLHDFLRDLMLPRVVTLPESATVLEACEYFVLYKYLAFPIVNEQRQILGIVDVGAFTQEVFDIAEMAEREQKNDLFETLGFRIAELRDASPWRAFRYRFPWLLTTMFSGMAAALITGAFETTLAKSLVLAFFLTMVLGLAESVSMQSMTLTIQSLRSVAPNLEWYWRTFRKEMVLASLLGTAAGIIVGLLVWFWRGSAPAACAIGGSLVLAFASACFFGISIPALLHRLKLDPKIAAGPATLAVTDVFTLLFYFGIGSWVLR